MSIALNQREKILAGGVLVLLGVVVFYFLFMAWRGPRQPLLAQKAQATAELQRRQNRMELARQAEQQLEAWRRRSLPANAETAASLYQNWLLQTARDAGFTSVTIDAALGRGRPEVFQVVRLNLQAAAGLEELTAFLHRFYRAGYLHQIAILGVVPEGRGGRLSVQMTIEALSLPTAKRADELPEAPSDRALATLDEYRDAIAKRNLFAAYQPPPPPPRPTVEVSRPAPRPTPPAPPPRPRFDVARHAYLTGIVKTADGRWQAWIHARTSDERFELFEGDAFQVGDARGRMLRIEEREAEVEFDGKRYVVALGDNLRDPASPRD